VLRRFVYHHPLFTRERAAAQARHRDLVSANRTSYCGAYWGNGFHEDGVNSALAVCCGILRKEHAWNPVSTKAGSGIDDWDQCLTASASGSI
jgi:predicted NAD/FAD-binding protein